MVGLSGSGSLRSIGWPLIGMLMLASASPARRRLLEQAAVDHRVRVSGVDEATIHHTDPSQLVQRLAEAKASAVLASLDPVHDQEISCVLGCDSVFEFEGEVFGKPADAEQALRRWRRMAGRSGSLHTGHVLLNVPTASGAPALSHQACITTKVHFAAVGDAVLQRYVASGEPMQCAGGFALEGRGGLLVASLSGCYSNVIGLSLPWLRAKLLDETA